MSKKRQKKKRKANHSAEPTVQVAKQVAIPEPAEGVTLLTPVEPDTLPAPVERLTLPEPVEIPIEIELEIEEFVSSPETQVPSEDLADALEIQTETEDPASVVEAPTEAEKQEPAATTVPSKADRRAHPRYAFAATVEVIAAEPDARIKSRVRDLSQQGCYVDTERPLALGIETEVRITKGAKSFEARARVVYNQPGKGMGLMFTAVDPADLGTLDGWIGESRETSWLAANRRRSQRVLMKIPVRVSGQTGTKSLFEEDTHTLAVSAHGASLVVATPVSRGQRFALLNLTTNETLECVVAHIGGFPGEPVQVGVEFMLPNPTFWRVAFPPKDWTPRHPDAKSR
jgi:hypothetical protein